MNCRYSTTQYSQISLLVTSLPSLSNVSTSGVATSSLHLSQRWNRDIIYSPLTHGRFLHLESLAILPLTRFLARRFLNHGCSIEGSPKWRHLQIFDLLITSPAISAHLFHALYWQAKNVLTYPSGIVPATWFIACFCSSIVLYIVSMSKSTRKCGHIKIKPNCLCCHLSKAGASRSARKLAAVIKNLQIARLSKANGINNLP